MSCDFPTNANIYFALDGSLVQWRIVPVVPGIGVRTVTQQEADHFGVAKRTSIVQRNEPTIIPGMDIGPGLQEVFHHIFPAKA